jgi:hypothetical protein
LDFNVGALGAGHLNLAIFERIPARRLMDDQGTRLYNLNPARGGRTAFQIVFRRLASLFALAPFHWYHLHHLGLWWHRAVSTPIRLLALSEALTGFGFISLAVTYLVSLTAALERKRAVALFFYHQAGKAPMSRNSWSIILQMAALWESKAFPPAQRVTCTGCEKVTSSTLSSINFTPPT